MCAIYGDENFSPAGGLWEIRLPFSGDDDDDDDEAEGANLDLDPTGAIFAATGRAPPSALAVRVVLLETYPSRSPPLVELDAALLPFGRYELAMNMARDSWMRPSVHPPTPTSYYDTRTYYIHAFIS